MSYKKEKIVAFEGFLRLRRTSFCAHLVFFFLILLGNICIVSSLSWGWQQIIPFGGIVFSFVYLEMFHCFLSRLAMEHDHLLYAECSGASIMLLLGCTPMVLYLFLSGNVSALSSWEYFRMYLSFNNIILPSSLLFFVLYSYWMLAVHLYNESEIYYNCIKFKQENGY